MFIFQPSCFALASQAATIFFAVSRLMAGLVSVAIAAGQQMTKQAASANRERAETFSLPPPYVDSSKATLCFGSTKLQAIEIVCNQGTRVLACFSQAPDSLDVAEPIPRL